MQLSASHLKRVYAGDAYEQWIAALDRELQLVVAAERSAKEKPKTSGKKRTQ